MSSTYERCAGLAATGTTLRGVCGWDILAPMPKRPSPLAAVLLLAVACAAGCAGFLRRPDPPRLTVADVTLESATLFEQKYVVRLRIQNPNSFALPLEGLDYSLAINDQPFATGVCAAPVTVPAYGTEVVDVDAYSSLVEILRQFLALGRGDPQKLSYRLKGHVRLKSPALKVPFEQVGEISLAPGKRSTGI